MIQFYLKTPKESNSLIMMRIYDARFKDGVFHYSTRERIDISKWGDGWPKGNTTINKVLNDFKTDATDFMLLNRKTGYTRESLRDHLSAVSQPQEENPQGKKSSLPMIEEWKEYHDIIKGKVESHTFANYDGARKAFKDFMKGNLNLLPKHFTFKTYNQWEVYLRDRYAPNSAAKHLKTFKRFIGYLVKERIEIGFDEEDIIYEEVPGLQIAVNEEILNKLYKHKFIGWLNDVRWIFILHCYTGLRVSDLFRVCENIKGNFIVLETQKVKGKTIKQPIMAMTREILERYDYKIPQMYEQDYRDGIKQIYKAVDPDTKIQIRDHKTNRFKNVFVHEEISSHDAVRTFITMCANKGITVNSIAIMTGKSVAVILRHYLVDSVKVAQEEMLEKFDTPVIKVKQRRQIQSATLSLGL